jgi:hypothetical protein
MSITGTISSYRYLNLISKIAPSAFVKVELHISVEEKNLVSRDDG